MKKILIPVACFLGVLTGSNVFAGEAEVRKGLKELDPHIPIGSIKKSVIKDLYEVVIGTEIYYVSSNGKYIISGNIFEAKTQHNITEASKAETYLKVVNKAGDSGMIIYEPKGKVRRTVTVFTDLDCPYCRKFHEEVPAHLAKGIRVRYVMFPLRGLGTDTYKKSVSVWCSQDRLEAMTRAKSGKSIEEKDCKNPVAENYALARAMGVSGTPSILTDKGVLYRGYVPKDELHARLGLLDKQKISKN